ncbi:beta-lactamase family protein [Glycomyces sp. TRM65418]|uniref:serine hydrolase domain-containing protein n=1 Tax=Glycomyces sp. TRM65418 TaxID=2867006 RepID=UPI001CE4EBCF|nr:serine hydrolase domain-containing protein [Glycomyces sp. TRM65418]MCC3764673.1 beta-lactamase family protein [Glycomyces sp. TRM65418]QZD54333.1 beta-lactamase family protein [Glycomyces sp. TRM65418]
MSPAAAGDEALAMRLGDLLGRHRHAAAAAVVSTGATAPEDTTTAVIGADAEADFEIGSISKGVTGLLYVDAIERGEVTPETALGDLLPLKDVPVGRVTLGALSVHRSGLPSLPAAAQPYRRSFAVWRHGANPYGEDLGQLLEQARTVKPGRPRPRYANFGFELLGHALAAAAHTTYVELLRTRIAEPLGLDPWYVPATADELRPGALRGVSSRGRPREPWTGEAIAPAGGIRASIGSTARLVRALLDGTAPGIAALDPVARFGAGFRIGAAWITSGAKGRAITWHNGGTGGFRSWLGLDREAGVGVVILSATAASVDRHGFALLREHAPPKSARGG